MVEDCGYQAGVTARGKRGAFGGRGWFPSVFPGFNRRVWFLLGAMQVFKFGHGLYYPLSTIHSHDVVGIPLSLVGVGLAPRSRARPRGFSGPLTDRYGRKPFMLLALSGSATTFLAYAFVGDFWGYLALSMVARLAGSAMFAAARNAMVADVAPEGVRARAYGLGGSVGTSAGPGRGGRHSHFGRDLRG